MSPSPADVVGLAQRSNIDGTTCATARLNHHCAPFNVTPPHTVLRFIRFRSKLEVWHVTRKNIKAGVFKVVSVTIIEWFLQEI